ncbi:MAG: hypothetical protein ACTSWA_03825 [Candidatus Thorarchaeota archaeon]
MKLSEIEPDKNVNDLSVRIISMAPQRIIKTRAGRTTMLKEVLIADDSGTAILSLWGFKAGNDISAGMVIKIEDGWAKEWQGKVQLSLGRSGKYEILEDDGTIPTIAELAAVTQSKTAIEE